MQPLAVAQARLDRVAEGVTVVQDGAQARLLLVLADHPGLDLARAAHGVDQRFAVARQQLVQVGFEPGEEFGVGDRAVLDDLGQAGQQLALGQGIQRVEVADHAQRLVEGADHVLAGRVVDGRLATHARIDLRQQRGRHLHEGHATHVAGRSKPGHVAHHAAAQRVQHRLAVGGLFQQLGEDLVERGPVFELLAIGQLDVQHLFVQRGDRRAQLGRVERPDRGVSDDQGLGRLGQPGEALGLQQPTADQDVVAAITQVDGHQGVTCVAQACGGRGGGGSGCHRVAAVSSTGAPNVCAKFGPGRDARGIHEVKRVTSLDPGTGGKRLGLLRSRSDPVGRASMQGGPSPTIVREARHMRASWATLRHPRWVTIGGITRPAARA